ncbi:MAG TPA: helix-turn-helix domain-containing protein [Ruminiclostridium sp.]|nr:helix-turn-helix domain-containing protein [Ruminiclostridium sp.]
MEHNISYEQFVISLKDGSSRDNCYMRGALQLLQGKWTCHIIYMLCRLGKVRFGELKKSTPEITNTMLTNTLRELEADGIVIREQFNEIPPHVEYSLSEKGQEIIPIFYEMYMWSSKYKIPAK